MSDEKDKNPDEEDTDIVDKVEQASEALQIIEGLAKRYRAEKNRIALITQSRKIFIECENLRRKLNTLPGFDEKNHKLLTEMIQKNANILKKYGGLSEDEVLSIESMNQTIESMNQGPSSSTSSHSSSAAQSSGSYAHTDLEISTNSEFNSMDSNAVDWVSQRLYRAAEELLKKENSTSNSTKEQQKLRLQNRKELNNDGGDDDLIQYIIETIEGGSSPAGAGVGTNMRNQEDGIISHRILWIVKGYKSEWSGSQSTFEKIWHASLWSAVDLGVLEGRKVVTLEEANRIALTEVKKVIKSAESLAQSFLKTKGTSSTGTTEVVVSWLKKESEALEKYLKNLRKQSPHDPTNISFLIQQKQRDAVQVGRKICFDTFSTKWIEEQRVIAYNEVCKRELSNCPKMLQENLHPLCQLQQKTAVDTKDMLKWLNENEFLKNAFEVKLGPEGSKLRKELELRSEKLSEEMMRVEKEKFEEVSRKLEDPAAPGKTMGGGKETTRAIENTCY